MYDVVIVGGGPVGLFLACELKLAGVDPVVIERLPEASQADKAHGLSGQVVRLLDHRGLFERLGGVGAPRPMPWFFFGTLPLPLHVLGDDNPMYMLPVNQRDIERTLGERAAELGVEVRRGVEVSSITQTPSRVEIDDITARYVVGCDGGHSTVRKQAGIAFPGVVDERVISRAALIEPTDQISTGPDGRVTIKGYGTIPGLFLRTERGVFMTTTIDNGHPFVTTLEWEDGFPEPGPPMTFAEMEDSVERVLGVRVALVPPSDGSPTLLRRIKGRNTRLADHYRSGRIFLAGDAAHVHAASGGPGLNLGLQDAANLAWKLAAELHGWAPSSLLDSYETERRALGLRVFTQTQSQTALMAPGSDVTALRTLFTEMLGNRDNVRYIADLMAGSDVRYDMGAPDPADATGRFAPSLDLGTARLPELFRGARPALVDRSGGSSLASVVEPWSDRVDRAAFDASGASLLVRPDGYVAWSGTDPEGLRAALIHWFGPTRALRSSTSPG